MKGKVMKKYMILMVSIFFMMASVVLADDAIETCANGAGRIVTGKITGNKYCMSETKMNWWNAVAWCDGQGKRLVSLDDCGCSDTTANCAGSNCPELKLGINSGWLWTATPGSSSDAYYIRLDDGFFSHSSELFGRAQGKWSALCY